MIKRYRIRCGGTESDPSDWKEISAPEEVSKDSILRAYALEVVKSLTISEETNRISVGFEIEEVVH
jgi:hypothetical protein